MSDKINGIALSTNSVIDANDYGMVTDPTTGCPIIFQLSDNPDLPLSIQKLELVYYTVGQKKVTVVFSVRHNK